MDNKKSQGENRKFERAEIPDLKVSFNLLDPRTWSTYLDKTLENIENISLGGLAFRSATPLERLAPVGLDIRIGPEQQLVKTFGRVAWIKKNEGEDYSLGVRFSWWKDEADKKTIYNLIKQHVS